MFLIFVQGGHSSGKPGKVVRKKLGKMEKVREKSGKLKFASDFERAEELKLQLFGSLWAWTFDMFIIDTLVAFSKLVTMLVIINVKQRLFKRYAVYR